MRVLIALTLVCLGLFRCVVAQVEAADQTSKRIALQSSSPREPLNPSSQQTVRNAKGKDGVIGDGMLLARMHKPELLPLLEQLERSSPESYEAAVRDLSRHARRLEGIRKRDAILYEVSLREWQARIDVQLSKARLGVRGSDRDKELLKSHVRQLAAVRAERIGREIELLDQRIDQMRQRVVDTQAQVESMIEARESLLRDRSRWEDESQGLKPRAKVKEGKRQSTENKKSDKKVLTQGSSSPGEE